MHFHSFSLNFTHFIQFTGNIRFNINLETFLQRYRSPYIMSNSTRVVMYKHTENATVTIYTSIISDVISEILGKTIHSKLLIKAREQG